MGLFGVAKMLQSEVDIHKLYKATYRHAFHRTFRPQQNSIFEVLPNLKGKIQYYIVIRIANIALFVITHPADFKSINHLRIIFQLWSVEKQIACNEAWLYH